MSGLPLQHTTIKESGHLDLLKQAVEASLDAVEIVEEVAPLSAYHVHYATLYFKHLCRLARQPHAKGESDMALKVSSAADKLFNVWIARHRPLLQAVNLLDSSGEYGVSSPENVDPKNMKEMFISTMLKDIEFATCDNLESESEKTSASSFGRAVRTLAVLHTLPKAEYCLDDLD
eukprot:TRINITY_DN14411_c0_g1_i1.p2 TRINITY_DN14411_c0_g1~~TRINITY_DN14411_c0_g1_i1.p2  ORF type:complete len:175 (+),score=28.18 TRINITY_DN14411_c0_g1_i1:833-1357(+)